MERNDTSVTIFEVTPQLFSVYQEDIEECLEKALHYNDEYTVEAIFESFRNQDTKILVCIKGGEVLAAITVEIRFFPSGKSTLSVSNAGGREIETWLPTLVEVVEGMGKIAMCNAVYVGGREGWLRKLRKYGYSHQYTVIGKKLGE